ncbi:hypothetical protein ACFLQ2_00795 [archaeon]
MTQTSKGSIGIEFVVATALFLVAFWFIYFQSALMLTPQMQRSDVREIAVEFYSSTLIASPGEPENWAASPTQLGFADMVSGSSTPGVLNKTKLDWADGQDCDSYNTTMAGMEFAWKVTTSVATWECNTDIPKVGVIKRPVIVYWSGWAYRAGTMEVWAA